MGQWKLTSLNVPADQGLMLMALLKSPASRKMADNQTNVAPQSTTAKDSLRSDGKRVAEERWIADALEDDEVREALKSLLIRPTRTNRAG